MVMDAAARFRSLFDEAYPALRGYALHRGLNGADADDLVAATLEIAWRRLADVPADEPLPWLYGVARNLLRNKRRQERRWDALRARLPVPRPQADAAGDVAELSPGALRRALDELSADDQELLKLIAWDGLTPAQAATVLGCTDVAARTRLHRARNRLARRLGLDPRVQRSPGSGHIPVGGDLRGDAREVPDG
jgi:RNA polymerase sigma-70 factor, ECF subfamily